jgi:hypothetical protein
LNGSDPSMIVVSAVACLSFKAHRHAALSLDKQQKHKFGRGRAGAPRRQATLADAARASGWQSLHIVH